MFCRGATTGKGPGLSQKNLDSLIVLALLDFFEKLFGLLFVLGIVGKLYGESPNGGEKAPRRRPILHRYVAPRQLQPAGDDRRIESDSFVQILDGFLHATRRYRSAVNNRGQHAAHLTDLRHLAVPYTINMVGKAVLRIEADGLLNGAANLSCHIDLLGDRRYRGHAPQRGGNVEVAPDHARIRLDRLASVLLSDLVLLQSLRSPVRGGLRNHVTEINVDSSCI